MSTGHEHLICTFEARAIKDDEMTVDGSKCFGCSACEYACPEEAIEMVPRKAGE